MGADAKGVGPARPQQGVYLPVGQHGAEGLILADELQVYIRVCVGLHVQHVPWPWSVVAALEPMDGLQVNAVLVLEDALDPNGRCLPEFGNAHALACQVLRDAYAGVGVDEHEGVAENPRGKGGYGHKWELAPGPQAHVQGQKHLRDIELSVLDHPVHQNGWRLDSHIGEVDAVWMDDAVAQGFSAVVRTAAETSMRGLSLPSPSPASARQTPRWHRGQRPRRSTQRLHCSLASVRPFRTILQVSWLVPRYASTSRSALLPDLSNPLPPQRGIGLPPEGVLATKLPVEWHWSL